jgi:hypothetical protein
VEAVVDLSLEVGEMEAPEVEAHVLLEDKEHKLIKVKVKVLEIMAALQV